MGIFMVGCAAIVALAVLFVVGPGIVLVLAERRRAPAADVPLFVPEGDYHVEIKGRDWVEGRVRYVRVGHRAMLRVDARTEPGAPPPEQPYRVVSPDAVFSFWPLGEPRPARRRGRSWEDECDDQGEEEVLGAAAYDAQPPSFRSGPSETETAARTALRDAWLKLKATVPEIHALALSHEVFGKLELAWGPDLAGFIERREGPAVSVVTWLRALAEYLRPTDPAAANELARHAENLLDELDEDLAF